jgi:hypothetical protein
MRPSVADADINWEELYREERALRRPSQLNDRAET